MTSENRDHDLNFIYIQCIAFLLFLNHVFLYNNQRLIKVIQFWQHMNNFYIPQYTADNQSFYFNNLLISIGYFSYCIVNLRNNS